MDHTSLTIIGLLVGLNVFYAALTHLKEKRNAERENRLIKAVIANNVAEYAGAEETPADRIEILEKENELAVEAGKLQKDAPERRIAIS